MISDAVVYGDRRPYLVALVTLDGDAAARRANVARSRRVRTALGNLDDDARCSLLAPALAAEARLVPADTIALPPVAREVLDTFAMLRDALSSGYGDTLGAAVISGWRSICPR